MFPFIYEGATYYDCTSNKYGKWCGIQANVSTFESGLTIDFCIGKCTKGNYQYHMYSLQIVLLAYLHNVSALSLVYSTAEYCAPVWCRSTHTRLIDSILDDALCIVTECLRPTPTKDLPVLTGIQPAELRRLGATLSLANRAIHDPDHVLHGQLVGKQDAHLGRLRSRRPFLPDAWKLLGSLSKRTST